MSTRLLPHFQRLYYGLSGQSRHYRISAHQKDLLNHVAISIQQPLDNIPECNSITTTTNYGDSTHSNSESMFGHIFPISHRSSQLETTTSHDAIPQHSPLGRDHDRALIIQRVVNSGNSRELFDLLYIVFRNSIDAGIPERSRHEESLWDMKLVILILEQCERLMDMRLPWILLSQIRRLDDKLARRIIGMDVYNTILKIIIHTPNKISNRYRDFWDFHTSDVGEMGTYSSAKFGRSPICICLIERTIDEVYRYKLKWNLNTYDLLLQYYLMGNRMLKANWLLNRLYVYMNRLERRASLSSSAATSTSETINIGSGSQESYPKARHIYMKYKRVIEEIQDKRRQELFNSSPLIIAEKKATNVFNWLADSP
jgi:hypothetical protein